MSEPTITAQTSTALSSALGLALVVPNLDGSAILASMCGAAILILSKEKILRAKACVLFVISFVLGILFADFATDIIQFLLPHFLAEKVPLSLGALLVSLLVVQSALFLLQQDLKNLIELIKGAKK